MFGAAEEPFEKHGLGGVVGQTTFSCGDSRARLETELRILSGEVGADDRRGWGGVGRGG